MQRNVVLIILDTVRKDYFDEYAPRINKRADTSFEECRSAATWSPPSHASILTGELLHSHGVHDGSQSFGQIDEVDTFLHSLDDHHKFCITDHGLLQPTYEFDKFFDTHRTTGWEQIVNNANLESSLEKYWTALGKTLTSGDPYTIFKNVERGVWNEFPTVMRAIPSVKRPDQGAAELTRIAKSEVSNAPEPFFLFMNYMDAHTKYYVNKHLDPELHSVPEDWENDSHFVWESDEFDDEYLENYRELYGASIEYLDRKVSELIEFLTQNTGNETTVLITADHGHNLGYSTEDNLVGHMASVSEGVLHVPLVIINPPDGFPDSIDDYFSHLDLGTLIEYISKGISSVDDIVGSPIPVEHEGLVGYREKFDEFPGSRDEFDRWNRVLRAVYDEDIKYVYGTEGYVEAYDVNTGMDCHQRLLHERPEFPDWDDRLYEYGIAELQRTLQDGDVSTDVRDDLRDLGYL